MVTGQCRSRLLEYSLDFAYIGLQYTRSLAAVLYIELHLQIVLNGVNKFNKQTSDISAGVCSVFGAHIQTNTRECPSTSTGAIVGTVVAVAAVLNVAVIVVAAVVILRSRRGKLSLQKDE